MGIIICISSCLFSYMFVKISSFKYRFSRLLLKVKSQCLQNINGKTFQQSQLLAIFGEVLKVI